MNAAATNSARTIRTSKAVALAKIEALETALAAATAAEERATLTARIWAVREIAGLRRFARHDG